MAICHLGMDYVSEMELHDAIESCIINQHMILGRKTYQSIFQVNESNAILTNDSIVAKQQCQTSCAKTSCDNN